MNDGPGKYAPPTVRDRLAHIAADVAKAANDNILSKDSKDLGFLDPIKSDLRTMPMHVALGMAEEILIHLNEVVNIQAYDLALAMNKWARGEKRDGDYRDA